MVSLCMFRTGYEFTFRNHCYDFSPTYLLTKTMSRVVGNYGLLKQYQMIVLTLFLVCNVAQQLQFICLAKNSKFNVLNYSAFLNACMLRIKKEKLDSYIDSYCDIQKEL